MLLTPLGEKDVPPARRYLAKFWARVSYALEGVDSTCRIADLPRATIDRLGHLILGEAAWDLISNLPFQDWAGFQQAVEDRFGMDEEHQEDLFTFLDIKPGEDGLDFIQRVEDTRATLGFTHREALVKAWNCLPSSITAELRLKMDTLDKGKARWSDVLRYAKRRLAERESGAANAKLIPTRATVEASSSRTTTTKPSPPVRNARPPPPPPVTRAPRGRGQHAAQHDHQAATGGKEPCWICVELGGPNPTNHAVADCFLNPRSSHFRPDYRKFRLKKLGR